MSVIAIPTAEEMPADMRPSVLDQEDDGLIRLRAEVPDIDMTKVPKAAMHYVMVLPVLIPRKTPGGLDLPVDAWRQAKLRRNLGTLVSIGDLAWSEWRRFPEDYAPFGLGDWVLFNPGVGTQTYIRDKSGNTLTLICMRDSDVMAAPQDPDVHMILV
jgi:co-chaperonin GroES (HSP10)